jgi:hypothetical protein
LDTLGIKEAEVGFLCKLILIRKIPDSCYREFQRCFKKSEDRNLTNLLKFLADEVSIWERVGMKEEQSLHVESPREQRNQNVQKPYRSTREKIVRQSMVVEAKESDSCLFCSKAHVSAKCALSREEKFEVAKKLRLCLNCLKPGHFAFRCRSPARCPLCKAKHHEVFHRNKDEPQVTKVSTSLISPGRKGETRRLVVSVGVAGPKVSRSVRALLDDGSTATFVSEAVVKELSLKKVGQQQLELTTFGAKPKMVQADVVALPLPEARIIQKIEIFFTAPKARLGIARDLL